MSDNQNFPPMNQPPPQQPPQHPPPQPGYQPPYPGTPQKRNWVLPFLIGCAGILGLGGVLTIGGLYWLGSVSPDTKAIKGSAMKSEDVQTLKDLGYLEDGEQILYFYSDGLLGVEEQGSFFTEKRVVVYEEGDAPGDVEQAYYHEIGEIDLEEEESWIENSTVVVVRKDGSALYLPVSNEEDGDRKFHSRLVQEWKKNGG